MSKYHFLRLFRATYGMTPMEYVSRRRIERAQDLLRATNLTVTEVCFAVGFSSLGSFSSRFRALVGESAERLPAALCRRRAAHSRAASSSCGAWRNGSSRPKTAIAEKRDGRPPS